jgi:hypothetical protein
LPEKSDILPCDILEPDSFIQTQLLPLDQHCQQFTVSGCLLYELFSLNLLGLRPKQFFDLTLDSSVASFSSKYQENPPENVRRFAE